ncbi:MAG: M61 family metallopeptidase [bacterium]
MAKKTDLSSDMKIKRILLFCAAVGFIYAGINYSFNNTTQNDFEKILYTLSVDENGFEYFHVSIEIDNLDSSFLNFRMPRWAPGAYRLREYFKNVRNFKAFDRSGKNLEVQRISEDAWQVRNSNSYVLVEYDVKPAFEFWSERTLDSTYALVQGPGVFMYLEGEMSTPILVKYNLPDGWKIASPLKQINGKNLFYAEGYDRFIDAPTQLGYFKQYGFELEDVPFELIVYGNADFSVDSFLVMVKDICQYQINLFRDIPFEKYIFFYKLLSGHRRGGGLEHFNATTIGFSRERLAQTVFSAAEVTAHEFFHVWNVKRIRPKVLGPFDYTKEARTSALWFCEGVTSYYELLTLVRTKIWSKKKFIDELEKQIEILQETPDRHLTSAERASWSIWERGYGHSGVSFYNKGQILGWLIDIKIRQATNNRFSLDDVMRFMNWWFAKENVGFEPGDIKRTINAISQTDFSEFFDKYVSGTVELPYEKILAYAGLNIQIQGKWVPNIGNFYFVGPRNRVVIVEANSPVEEAGLRRRDLILAIDGKDVSEIGEINEIVNAKEIGAQLVLKVLRDGVELNLPVEVGKKEEIECEIEAMNNPTGLQLNIQEGWLEGWTGQRSVMRH